MAPECPNPMTTVSPLAPEQFPDMPPVAGVTLATAAAGIRYPGRTDVLLALFEPGTAVAGVFTRSKCPSAPVDWCRAQLKQGARARWWSIRATPTPLPANPAARPPNSPPRLPPRPPTANRRQVFLASTGVIGEPLDATKFGRVMEQLIATAAPGAWDAAARAIMTTDTFPKGAAAGAARSDAGHHLRHRQGRRHDRARHGDDAVVCLHRCPDRAGRAAKPAQQGVADTFNAVTIDGDTSTSDTLLAFATGAAGARGVAKITRLSDPRLPAFRKAFDAVLANLAEQVARDGEGARKLVEIIVEGAVSKPSARKIALSIANSPLVKTAIAGEDANWGRVVMAVGKAGERADRDRLSIWFGGIRVAHKGDVIRPMTRPRSPRR